jgi:hypothetical protein
VPEKPMDLSLAVKHLCRAEESGALDSIECPSCHHRSVSIWFSHPKKNQYRTWFVCADCSFEAHAINQGRPTNFSEDRVNERLQARDLDVLGKMRFPWPDEE